MTVVALVLACGLTGKKTGLAGGTYKALLPVQGRVMADYVLTALQSSEVERVFIAQPPGGDLEPVTEPHGKNVFFTIQADASSLAATLGKSLENIVDFYPPEKLSEMLIMLVPSDIPLVLSKDFDHLIAQAEHKPHDVFFTLIPYEQIARAYPHKRFQRMFFSDYRQLCSPQSIAMIRGKLLSCSETPDASGYRLVLHRSSGEPIPGLINLIDGVRREREGMLVWPKLVYELLVKRLVGSRNGLFVVRLMLDMALRRMTIPKIHHYLELAFGLNFGALESDSVSFSGDIDNARDYDAIIRARPNWPA